MYSAVLRLLVAASVLHGSTGFALGPQHVDYFRCGITHTIVYPSPHTLYFSGSGMPPIVPSDSQEVVDHLEDRAKGAVDCERLQECPASEDCEPMAIATYDTMSVTVTQWDPEVIFWPVESRAETTGL